MESAPGSALEPEAVLDDVLGLDAGLRRVPYYGERAIFYNPGGARPLGVILAAVKDRDGPNDRSARLSRAGVYRFAFGMAPGTYRRRFGEPPARPPRGGVVDLPGYDPTRLGELMPHPVYGWMSWVQILAPTAADLEALREPVAEALEVAKARWSRHESRLRSDHAPDG